MPFTLEKTITPFQTLWMDTGSPPRYRTQTYQLLSTLNPTRSLFKNAGLSTLYTNYPTPPQTTSVANLKLHTNSSSNPDTPPVSTSVNPQIPPSPQRHLQVSTQSLLFYCWGRPLWFGEKSTFSFRFFSICLSDTHLRVGRRFCLS